jgi:hypothetical protein
MKEKPRPKNCRDISQSTPDTNSAQDDKCPKAPCEGVRWKDDIYLVSTSDIDGRRRWETIILLLAQKLQDSKVQSALLDLKPRE